MTTPLRICLVAPVPPPHGGIGHWTLMVLRNATERIDVQLEIVDIAPRWRAIDDLAAWKRVLGGGLQLLRDLYRVLWRLRHHPHVIHLTTSGQFAIIRDLAIMTIAKRFNVPIIYHIRFGRVPQEVGKQSREWLLLARAMRMAHTVIVIDARTAQAIQRFLPYVRVVNIPNCINAHSFLQPTMNSDSGKTVMFLGWVIPTKGVEELVQAWAELQPAGWRLLIVGPGNTEYQQRLIEKYHPAQLEFLGEKSHNKAMRLMADADVFVLPSYTEGFPNVVLEAMALGKPIIATREGAIPEMLADGCGVLVNKQNTLELRDALLKVLKDSDLRRCLGARARERVLQEYSIESIFSQYMAIWRQAAVQK